MAFIGFKGQPILPDEWSGVERSNKQIVVPDHDKIRVQDGAGDLRITIRVTTPPFALAPVGFGLAVFVSMEIGAINALLNGGLRKGEHYQLPWMTEAIANGPDFNRLMLTWIAFGAIAVLLLAGIFLWNIAGKEIIELNAATLKYTRRIPLLGYSREYSTAKITRLRLVPFPWTRQQNFSYFGFKDRTIAFDYGRRTRRMGSGLDEANAHYVIQKMRERMMSLGTDVEAA
jgi:hypothetical protein